VFPGTAENRAKKAAQERIDGQLPHSILNQVDHNKDGNVYNLPMDKQNDFAFEKQSTGDKLKAMIPGTEQHKAKDFNDQKNFHWVPKATDGFTTGEKLKAELPGTAEHRAKQAAQDRIDGQLPHSIIGQVETPQSKVE